MRTPLIVALGLAALLAGTSLVRGEESAYSSLVGLASASEDRRPDEGRLPEGADGPLQRGAAAREVPAPPLTERRVAPAAPRRLTRPSDEEALRDAVRDERTPVVAAPSPRPASTLTRLFSYLLPSSRSGVPELKASSAAYAGARLRMEPASYVPRETEEGVRRGMADMMALMSAGGEPAASGR